MEYLVVLLVFISAIIGYFLVKKDEWDAPQPQQEEEVGVITLEIRKPPTYSTHETEICTYSLKTDICDISVQSQYSRKLHEQHEFICGVLYRREAPMSEVTGFEIKRVENNVYSVIDLETNREVRRISSNNSDFTISRNISDSQLTYQGRYRTRVSLPSVKRKTIEIIVQPTVEIDVGLVDDIVSILSTDPSRLNGECNYGSSRLRDILSYASVITVKKGER